MADKKKNTQPFPPPRFFTCTIAIGSMSRRNTAQFRRVAVVGGNMLPDGMQEVISGIAPGQQVVANALAFQNSVEQQ